MQPPRFTAEDADRANAEWGANCGPIALAAIMGMTLAEVRPHMGGFERLGYTNPTTMKAALQSIGRHWCHVGRWPWPDHGLARIQWEGPWTQPGVPMRARYRFTHWVAAARRGRDVIGVFDCNALDNGTGWCALADWEAVVVPYILEHCVPRASGRWHLTHVIEVARP